MQVQASGFGISPIVATLLVGAATILSGLLVQLASSHAAAKKIEGARGERDKNQDATNERLETTDKEQWAEINDLKDRHADLDKRVTIIEKVHKPHRSGGGD